MLVFLVCNVYVDQTTRPIRCMARILVCEIHIVFSMTLSRTATADITTARLSIS